MGIDRTKLTIKDDLLIFSFFTDTIYFKNYNSHSILFENYHKKYPLKLKTLINVIEGCES